MRAVVVVVAMVMLVPVLTPLVISTAAATAAAAAATAAATVTVAVAALDSRLHQKVATLQPKVNGNKRRGMMHWHSHLWLSAQSHRTCGKLLCSARQQPRARQHRHGGEPKGKDLKINAEKRK